MLSLGHLQLLAAVLKHLDMQKLKLTIDKWQWKLKIDKLHYNLKIEIQNWKLKYQRHLNTPSKHLTLLLSHLEVHDDNDQEDEEEDDDEGNDDDGDVQS